MKTVKIVITLICILFLGKAQAQVHELTLEKTITIAGDSSLQAFLSKNRYLAGYWQYRTFKADRLPSLTLNLTPAEYNRGIIRRYDSESDIDVYRKQQSFYAGGGVNIMQNFDLLGGTFYINSNLDYLRNFGSNTSTQFTTVPIRVGYRQNLLGYNSFSWEKKIEPLKYEKVKKEFISNMENVSIQATGYFFRLAMAQVEYDMAVEKVASSDTLYRTGQERHKIASISKGDLLTLKLDAVNARNTLENKKIELKQAMFNLASFLNFDKNTEIRLRLPSRPRHTEIGVEEALAYARENNPDFLTYKQAILEAEKQVDRTKKEAMFNASLNASFGFNQAADAFRDVYRNLMDQEIISLSVSIPLVDWGVRKGKYNMAKSELNVAQISARQNEISIEENLIMTVSAFNIQLSLIDSAEEALDLSIMAYEETKQRFLIGKADINSLTLAQNRQETAQRNYISALQTYWSNYYKIRQLTLYDFELKIPLSREFDYKHYIQ